CGFGHGDFNFLFHGVERKFLVGRKRLPIFLQALQVAFDGFHCPRMSFFIGVALRHEAMQGRTGHNVAAFLSGFKKDGITMFRHRAPLPIVRLLPVAEQTAASGQPCGGKGQYAIRPSPWPPSPSYAAPGPSSRRFPEHSPARPARIRWRWWRRWRAATAPGCPAACRRWRAPGWRIRAGTCAGSLQSPARPPRAGLSPPTQELSLVEHSPPPGRGIRRAAGYFRFRKTRSFFSAKVYLRPASVMSL